MKIDSGSQLSSDVHSQQNIPEASRAALPAPGAADRSDDGQASEASAFDGLAESTRSDAGQPGSQREFLNEAEKGSVNGSHEFASTFDLEPLNNSNPFDELLANELERSTLKVDSILFAGQRTDPIELTAAPARVPAVNKSESKVSTSLDNRTGWLLISLVTAVVLLVTSYFVRRRPVQRREPDAENVAEPIVEEFKISKAA